MDLHTQQKQHRHWKPLHRTDDSGGPGPSTASPSTSTRCQPPQFSDTSSMANFKEAYRRLARQLHPDKGGSHEGFIQLQAAYKGLRANKMTAFEADSAAAGHGSGKAESCSAGGSGSGQVPVDWEQHDMQLWCHALQEHRLGQLCMQDGDMPGAVLHFSETVRDLLALGPGDAQLLPAGGDPKRLLQLSLVDRSSAFRALGEEALAERDWEWAEEQA